MQELPQEALLHTIAEVAAAFVGFSLVGGLFSEAPREAHRLLSLRAVAFVSLLCLAGALLPSAMAGFAFDQATTWRVASTSLAAAWIASATWGIRSDLRELRAGPAGVRVPRYLLSGPASAVVGNLLLIWNVASPVRGGSPLYIVSLLLLLGFAALSFIAAVFHGRSTRSAA